MDINKARALAIELMDDNGLLPEWVFKFDTAVKRFGNCSYTKKTISLSKTLVLLNDEAQVRDTILHEVAHALAGHAAGHGPVWKEVALSLGCNPSRTSDGVVPEGRYVGTCGNCKKQSTKHRRPKGRVACARCCKRFNGGRFTTEFLIVWVDTKAARV